MRAFLLTCVKSVEVVIFLERGVVKPEVHRDGTMGGLLVKLVTSQFVLQSQQVNIGTKSHLAHTVRVEIKLVLDNLREMLSHKEKRYVFI